MKRFMPVVLSIILVISQFTAVHANVLEPVPLQPTPDEIMAVRNFPFTDDDFTSFAIINGGKRDFKDGIQNVKCDITNESPNVDVEWVADDGVGQQPGCVRIKVRGDRYTAQPMIYVRLRKDKQYKLSFDAKTQAGSNSLEAIFIHPAGSHLYDFPINVGLSDKWQHFESNYTYNGDSPYDYSQIILRLGSISGNGDSVYYIDNFNLVMIDQPDEEEIKVQKMNLFPLKKEIKTPDYLDTKSHSAKDAIEYLFNKGIFSNSDLFRPDDIISANEVEIIKSRAAILPEITPNMTRAEFAAALFELMEKNKQTVFYVDGKTGSDSNGGTKETPFKTIQKAKEFVREASYTMDDDIYVFVNNSTYYQDKTLSFTASDSGKNGYSIIYKAPVGQQPVISGGKVISGWKVHDRTKNIYKAPAHGIHTRQLFVNGVRATRAASTGGLADETLEAEYGHTTTDLSLLDFKRATDLEFSYRGVWIHSRSKVEKIEQDGDRAKIIMEPVTWKQICGGSQTSANRIDKYENAYELLDEEGEFYLDTVEDIFYYKPRKGENMDTVLTEAAVLEKIVNVEDAFVETAVRNIRFDGVTFNHSTWLRTEKYGYVSSQNNVIVDVSRNELHTLPPPAVHVRKSRNISFERCEFSKLGSNGLIIDFGTQYSPVNGCHFTDISGCAVYIGTPQLEGWSRIPKGNLRVRSNHVMNNVFHNIGVEYYEGTAISVGYPSDMNIMYNEIYDMPYSAMHLGYGWHTIDTSSFTNTMVAYNYVYDIMKKLYDGGAIYTLGRTEGKAVAYDESDEDKVIKVIDGGNYIFYNYLKDQWNHTAVIYNDQGSNFWDIQYNVIDQTEADSLSVGHGPANWYMSNMSATEANMVKNNYCTNQYWNLQGIEGLYEQAQLFDNLNIPPEAEEIIDATGRQLKYRDYDYDTLGYIRIDESFIVRENESFTPLIRGADAKAFPVSLGGAKVRYESNDNRIVTPNSNGGLLALTQGVTDITCFVTKDGVTKETKSRVYVGDEFAMLSPVKRDYKVFVGNKNKIEIAGTSLYGQSLKLSNVTYTISDSSVAEIDNDGMIRGIKEGETVVTAKATGLGKTISTDITVKITNFGDPKYLSMPSHKINDWINNPNSWIDALNKHPQQNSGGILFAANSGQSIYEEKIQNELLDFNMVMSPEAAWPSILLRVTDREKDIWGKENDMYIIVFINGTIELHRFNLGVRTVIYGEMPGLRSIGGEAFPNGLFDVGDEIHVQTGTVNENNGTRIILNINGVNIFSFLDSEPKRLADEGYFGVLSTSGTILLKENK